MQACVHHTHPHACTHIHVYTQTGVFTNVDVHTHIHMNLHICECIHTHHKYICIHVSTKKTIVNLHDLGLDNGFLGVTLKAHKASQAC